ncbi:BrnT family toxin [Rudaea sp.]|uniref:BrnT family toxin n=1 Tax=Rudaea sp. TaxID=2136325 RepID=UPI0032200B8D
MHVEYDPAKARTNLAKHGADFEEAASCLLDPEALVREDIDASGEPRWALLGMSERAAC